MQRFYTLVISSISLFLTFGLSAEGHWQYSGQYGPEAWGKLSPKYTLCASGKNQSPIDLSASKPIELPALEFDYSASSLAVVNNGHTLKFSITQGSQLIYEEAEFQLLQFHMHAPSEHTIDGQYFPMEFHFVHQHENGTLLVVGVMVSEGTHNSSLEPWFERLPSQTDAKHTRDAEEYQLIDLLAELAPDYYRYTGSLTTPPCSEGVIWIVMNQPIEMSQEQINRVKGAVGHDNNRPVQPIWARALLQAE